MPSRTTWTYTPAGQPATVSYSGSSAHSVSYSYDADGNRTAMTDATGSSSYQYDPFGELTTAQNGAGQKTQYGYNADGQVTGITYPLPATATWATSDTVSRGYDNADRLNSVTDFNGHQLTIADTADGLPNSVGLGSSGDTITTSYDSTDAPSAITLKDSSSTLQSFTYSDSPAGDVLSETDTPSSSNSPAGYTYDAQGRVTSDTPGTGAAKNYGFDASSNLTTLPTGADATHGYDNAGELTSQTLSGTTTNYTYNADGQQLSSVQGSTTESSGTWNGAGQLTVYNNAAADMTAAAYNGDGLRMSSTTGGITQNYTWNTSGSLAQLLMDGANAYIYTTGVAPTEQVNLTTGAVTYLVADRLGSIRGAVSSTGALIATTTYDAWGNPEATSGSSTPFGYAGAYTDPSGLLYLINRYYSSQIGQFFGVDPDLASTLQGYAYAGDNPVSESDPTGMIKGVEYEKQYGTDIDNGQRFMALNIAKKCTKALNRCVVYFNTEMVGDYKFATDISATWGVDVGGYSVVSGIKYNKTKNGNEKPLFHGNWGFNGQGPSQWGKYIYGCGFLYLRECTGYMERKAAITIHIGGQFTLFGQVIYYGGPTTWKRDTGKVVDPWTGGMRWAGLPS